MRPAIKTLAPHLAPGQVLLIARTGGGVMSALSWAIRRVTGSRYSHAALIERTAGGIWTTVEAADADGVKALRLESYLEDEHVTGLLVRDAAITPEERAAIMGQAWLMVGSKYDMVQLLGIWLRRRMPWLFGGVDEAMSDNRLDFNDRYICSELVTLAYLGGAGINLAPAGVAVGMVDPGHLAVSTALVDVFCWRAPTGPIRSEEDQSFTDAEPDLFQAP